MSFQKNTQLSVVEVTPYAPNMLGGLEKTVENLCREFAKEGIRVTWCSSAKGMSQNVEGVTYAPMQGWDPLKRFGLSFPFWGPCSLVTLAKAIRGSDVVHLHDFATPCCLVALWIGKIFGKRTIITLHTAIFPPAHFRHTGSVTHAVKLLFAVFTLPWANEVTAVGRNPATSAEKCLGIHPVIVQNGTNAIFQPLSLKERAACRQDLGFPVDRPTYIFVGRFAVKKGLDVIRALAQRMPDTQWVLVGKGEVDPSSWNLKNVRIDGPFSDEAIVARYYQAADALVFPSREEGFSLALSEALSCRLRCVATTSVIKPMLVDPDLAAEVDDTATIEEWERALRRLATLPAPTRTFDNPGWKTATDAYVGVFKRPKARHAGPFDLTRKMLKRYIDSENACWWSIIEVALWMEKSVGWCLLPTRMLMHWRDCSPVLRLRKRIKNGAIAISYDVSRSHFGAMYEPISTALAPHYEQWKIVPDGTKSSDPTTLHSCWSLLVPWKVYVSCWFSTHHPNVLSVANAEWTVELYHGAGAAYMSSEYPTHSSILYRRELSKFKVHFATGPDTKRTALSLGPGRVCYEVGYPKSDLLFRNDPPPATVADDCDFPGEKPLIVYAPHHHASGSLSRYGADVVRSLLEMDLNVIVKFHGLLAAADVPMHELRREIESMANANARLRIARESEPGHYYKQADVVVGDTGSNSTGFEAMLCGKPTVLIRSSNEQILENDRSFEGAMARICETVDGISELGGAIERALRIDSETLEQRRREASSFLFNPGRATHAAVEKLTHLLEDGKNESTS